MHEIEWEWANSYGWRPANIQESTQESTEWSKIGI